VIDVCYNLQPETATPQWTDYLTVGDYGYTIRPRGLNPYGLAALLAFAIRVHAFGVPATSTLIS